MYSSVINNIVWSFQELGYTEDLGAVSNLKLAVEKLPNTLILKWDEQLITEMTKPNLIQFSIWLQDLAEAFDMLPRTKKMTAHSTWSTHSTQTRCLCDGDHTFENCHKINSMTTDERAELVKQKKLCFTCLRMGHVSRKCSSSKLCGVQGCPGKHHELLHNAKHVFAISETVTTVNTRNIRFCFKYYLSWFMGTSLRFPHMPCWIWEVPVHFYAQTLQRLDGSSEQLSLDGIQKEISTNVNDMQLKVPGQ